MPPSSPAPPRPPPPQELTLKGERDTVEAEEREKAEMDAMLHAKRLESAVKIQAAWRGCVAGCARGCAAARGPCVQRVAVRPRPLLGCRPVAGASRLV